MLSGQTSGLPEYGIEWRKIVSNNSQIQIPFVLVEENRASLILNQVSPDDSGHYMCLATSTQNNRVVAQERIQLIVEPLTDSFGSSLEVEDRVVKAEIDKPIEIRCFVRNTKDNLKLNWLKENSNLPETARVEDGILYIERVEEKDDGYYICTGFNEKTRHVEFTQKIRLATVGK